MPHGLELIWPLGSHGNLAGRSVHRLEHAGDRRDVERGQSDRRTRRTGGRLHGLCRIGVCGPDVFGRSQDDGRLSGHSVYLGMRRIERGDRRDGRGDARISCGSTVIRPKSSWATRASLPIGALLALAALVSRQEVLLVIVGGSVCDRNTQRAVAGGLVSTDAAIGSSPAARCTTITCSKDNTRSRSSSGFGSVRPCWRSSAWPVLRFASCSPAASDFESEFQATLGREGFRKPIRPIHVGRIGFHPFEGRRSGLESKTQGMYVDCFNWLGDDFQRRHASQIHKVYGVRTFPLEMVSRPDNLLSSLSGLGMMHSRADHQFSSAFASGASGP